MKSLNTQLASWSQLRHDTILYAKQSYTIGGLCEFPAVLVEPHPTFWMRMREMVARRRAAVAGLSYEDKTLFAYRPFWNPEAFAEAEALAEMDPAQLDEGQRHMLDRFIGQADLSAVKTRQVVHLERFMDTLGRLEAIVELQRVGGSLSESPSLHDFACDLIQQTSPGGGSGPPRTYDGWYAQLFYRGIFNERHMGFHEDTGVGKFDAIVADIHTDVPSPTSPGSVLHEGIGRVNLAFIAVEIGGQPVMFAGLVLSHFEFELVGPPRRLSDSQWKHALEGSEPIEKPLRPEWRMSKDEWGTPRQLPPNPPWTRDYLVPEQP